MRLNAQRNNNDNDNVISSTEANIKTSFEVWEIIRVMAYFLLYLLLEFYIVNRKTAKWLQSMCTIIYIGLRILNFEALFKT